MTFTQTEQKDPQNRENLQVEKLEFTADADESSWIWLRDAMSLDVNGIADGDKIQVFISNQVSTTASGGHILAPEITTDGIYPEDFTPYTRVKIKRVGSASGTITIYLCLQSR